MSYNFDVEVSRKGTSSVKWEYLRTPEGMVYGDHADPELGPERVLPLWVADMDFRTPQEVIDALAKRVAHGIFGYTGASPEYLQTIVDWCLRRYGWSIEPGWISPVPGVVSALYNLVAAFVKPGEKVLIQRPVYHPFTFSIEANGSEVVSNSLIKKGDRYYMDFDDLAEKAADPDVKMAILCSPHNPVGRVWTREELTRFGEICLANDVLVVSDEIHCDLIYPGHDYVAMGTLGDEILQNTVSTIAASKTFNLAGLKIASVIIANPEINKRFNDQMAHIGVKGVNGLGMVATQAAYTHGDQWLDEVMQYISGNFEYLKRTLEAGVPGVVVTRAEGTYLTWVDFSALNLSQDELNSLVFDEALLFLNDGAMFGPEGVGHQRINIACPRSILVEATERLIRVLTARG